MAIPELDLARIQRFCQRQVPSPARRALYWFDRNSRAHRYELLEPDQPIERLLAEYDADPTAIFKG